MFLCPLRKDTTYSGLTLGLGALPVHKRAVHGNGDGWYFVFLSVSNSQQRDVLLDVWVKASKANALPANRSRYWSCWCE